MTVRLSQAAECDLDQIIDDGERQFGWSAAFAYATDLVAHIDRLNVFPKLGRSRPVLGEGARTLRARSHVVIYTIDDDGVFVLRIRHAHEDWLID